MSFEQTDEVFELDEFCANRWSFWTRWVLSKQMKFLTRWVLELDEVFELDECWVNTWSFSNRWVFELSQINQNFQKIVFLHYNSNFYRGQNDKNFGSFTFYWNISV